MSIRKPDGTIIHMPFPGHRTMAEVDEQNARNAVKRVFHVGSRSRRG
jgi:hypothetical protein